MITKVISTVPLQAAQSQEVDIPAGSIILGVTRTVIGFIGLNVLHNEDQPITEKKTIVALPLGEPYAGGKRLKPINSVVINQLLFHFFEAV